MELCSSCCANLVIRRRLWLHSKWLGLRNWFRVIHFVYVLCAEFQ